MKQLLKELMIFLAYIKLKYLFTAFLVLILLFFSCNSFSQNKNDNSAYQYHKKWLISSAYGAQISGIKSEDFISSNVTPSFLLSVGTWFTPEIALQLAYKGFYFHTISDNDKHYYHFIFGEVLLNMNELINGNKKNSNKWNVIFHPGAGCFSNKNYNRPNVCGNIGIINSVKLTNHCEIFVDISAIMGWDIYQGNDDILPSCVLGLSYSFQ